MAGKSLSQRLRSLRDSDSLYIGAERLASAVLNLVALLAVARFLGVEAYGAFALAMSILGIGLALGHLGLDGLLLKRLIAEPERASRLLGTVSFTKYAIYLPAFAAFSFLPAQIGLTPLEGHVLQAIAPIFLIMPLTSGIIGWLNSRDLFRSPSLARILAVVVGSSAKLALIAGGFGLVSIGLAHTALFVMEFAVLAVLLFRHGGPLPHRWRFEGALVASLYRQAGPLFIASLAGMTYAQIDILMLRYLTDQTVVGEYAFVQQILQSAQIVPFAITLAAFPTLVRLEKEDLRKFFAHALSIALKIVGLGTLIALALVAVGPWLVVTLLGQDYAATGDTLRIGALALPFIFLRQLTSKMYICLERGMLLAVIECGVLVVAILLQRMAITSYGADGAAGVVILTYALASLGAYLCSGALVRRRVDEEKAQ